jgi:pimeloyl-ACP methyl ester carboxylesterase
LDNVVWIGVSLGGYLGARAAAFEPRIKRLFFFNVRYNFFDGITRWMPGLLRRIFMLCFNTKADWAINGIMNGLMKKKLGIKWLITHGMFVLGVKSPYEYYRAISRYTMEKIGHRITQDCLLLLGEKDHYIPFKHLELTQKALVNAKSVRSRVFTVAEGGEQHGQLGNIQLVVDEILDRLKGFRGSR